MRKTIITAYAISILMLVLSLIYFNLDNSNAIKTFSVDNYKEYIENETNNIYTHEINNQTEAKNIAEDLFVKIYGEDVLKEKPFNVSYDRKADTWLITGTFHGNKNAVGGVANLIVTSNGEVKAIWHEK